VNNDSSLFDFPVTDLPADILGKALKIKIKVTNIGGYVAESCEYLTVVVADVPEAPSAGPASDLSISSETILRVTYDEPATGGSVLTNYEVQMDDGLGGGFFTVAGGDLASEEYLDQHVVIESPLHLRNVLLLDE